MTKVRINTITGRELTGILTNRVARNGKALFVILDQKNQTGAFFAKERITEIKETNIKASGKIEFSKHEFTNMWDEVEKRTLTIYTTLKTKNGTMEDIENLLDEVSDFMENELSHLDVDFFRCPFSDERDELVEYGDGFDIEFQHGDMAEIRKDITAAWKAAKKHFKIR